jgi:hypothetical protein
MLNLFFSNNKTTNPAPEPQRAEEASSAKAFADKFLQAFIPSDKYVPAPAAAPPAPAAAPPAPAAAPSLPAPPPGSAPTLGPGSGPARIFPEKLVLPSEWVQRVESRGFRIEPTSGEIPSEYGGFARARVLGEWPFEDRTNNNNEIWFDAHGHITVPSQQLVQALETVLKYERGGTLTPDEIRTHNAFVGPYVETGRMPYNASHAFMTTAVGDYATAALRLIPEEAALGPDRSSGVALLAQRAERQRAENASTDRTASPASSTPEIAQGEPSRIGEALASRMRFDPTTLGILQERTRERNATSQTDVVLAYPLRDGGNDAASMEQIMLSPADARSLIRALDEAGRLPISSDEVFRANGIGGGNLPNGWTNTPENNLRYREATAFFDAMSPQERLAAAQGGALRIAGKEGVVFDLAEYSALTRQTRAVNQHGDGSEISLVIPRTYDLVGPHGVTRRTAGAELFPNLGRSEAIDLLNSAGGFRDRNGDGELSRDEFGDEDLSIYLRKGETDPIGHVLGDNGSSREAIERPGNGLDRQIEHWAEEYARRRRDFPLESEETSRRIILEQIPDATLRSFVEHHLRPTGEGLIGAPSGASMPRTQGAGGGGGVRPPPAVANGPESEGEDEVANAQSPFKTPRSLFNPQPEAMASAMEEWKSIVEEGIANGDTLDEILQRIAPSAQDLARTLFAGTPIANDYGVPRDSGARTTDLTHRLFESSLEPTLDFVESDWDNVVNSRTGESPSFPASELRERLAAGDPEVFDLVHLTKMDTPRGEVISAMVTFSPDPRDGSRGYKVVTAYPSNPDTIAKIREGLAESWRAATEIPPGDPAAVDAAAKFFHDYIHLYWHVHGNDEIGTTLIAGLLESKGFPIERLNPDASLSAGAFQNNRDDFAARFANGEYAELGVAGGAANTKAGLMAALESTHSADALLALLQNAPAELLRDAGVIRLAMNKLNATGEFVFRVDTRSHEEIERSGGFAPADPNDPNRSFVFAATDLYEGGGHSHSGGTMHVIRRPPPEERLGPEAFDFSEESRRWTEDARTGSVRDLSENPYFDTSQLTPAQLQALRTNSGNSHQIRFAQPVPVDRVPVSGRMGRHGLPESLTVHPSAVAPATRGAVDEPSEPTPQMEAATEAVQRYITAGTFTEDEFVRLRTLNGGMPLSGFLTQLALYKQGFGSGRLVTSAPTTPAPASSSSVPGEAVNLGQRPDLIGAANALLDRTIAEGNQPGASDRSLESAEVAQQISRHLAEDPNRVLAVVDDSGAITGMGAYSVSRNVFNPAENDILYAEALLRFGSQGSGVALTLLQSMYDRAPRGIMRLRSLTPGLDGHYESLGGRRVTTPGAAQNLFEWRRPPAVREK